MVSYFRDIWACRFFWLALVRMDLRLRYRRSVLGLGWSLLQPLAMMLILCSVFCSLMGIPWQELAPHLLTGLAVWNFFLGCTLQGCTSFFTNESYIRQCPLPMAIYPLRTVLGNSFHFLMAFIVVVIVHSVVHTMHPRTICLNLIPVFALYFVFAWSLATIAGLINVYFQDTQHLLEVGFQILFYITPILFPDKIVKERGLEWLVNLSPFTPFLRILRRPLTDGLTAPWEVWAQAGLTTLIAALLASLLMNRLSKKLIFHL